MKSYDRIVIGGGIAGSALSYELIQVGYSVLLLEESAAPQNATRYSYGGIAYWSGTTDLTRQLCHESIELHRQLSDELEGDTQFRELDLLLTITPDRSPEDVAVSYSRFAVPPALLSPEVACAIEPLLNPQAISGALLLRHGHVSPTALRQAYQRAFLRAGGVIEYARVTDFLTTGRTVQGVVTASETYSADQVIVCAGALSRALLTAARLPVRLYFTQAEVIETPPVDWHLQTLIMPAEVARFDLEAIAGRLETDNLWDQPGHEVAPAICDAGIVQFQDGHICMGQVSRFLTDPDAPVDVLASETTIRQAVEHLLPVLNQVPGTWHRCLVSFSSDRLPLVGAVPNAAGIHLFTGFSNPFALLPSIARRFAHHQAGPADPAIEQLSPQRLLCPLPVKRSNSG